MTSLIENKVKIMRNFKLKVGYKDVKRMKEKYVRSLSFKYAKKS